MSEFPSDCSQVVVIKMSGIHNFLLSLQVVLAVCRGLGGQKKLAFCPEYSEIISNYGFHLFRMLSTWYTFIFLLNFRATKSSNWNNNQTDYSSLSDSQFLFGSQFCPESSQTLSTPLDSEIHLRHPKQSQQNSLDVSLNSRISLHMFHSHYGDKL